MIVNYWKEGKAFWQRSIWQWLMKHLNAIPLLCHVSCGWARRCHSRGWYPQWEGFSGGGGVVQGRGRGVFKPSQGGSGACLPLKILSVCLSACICFLSLPVLSYLSFLWSGHLACFHQIYIPHHSSFNRCSSQFKEESSKVFQIMCHWEANGSQKFKSSRNQCSATRVS